MIGGYGEAREDCDDQEQKGSGRPNTDLNLEFSGVFRFILCGGKREKCQR